MSGRGKFRGGGGGRKGNHRQAVKHTFGNSRYVNNKHKDHESQDDDAPMQPITHKVHITGYGNNTNTEVLRTHLIGKLGSTAKFLEFNVLDNKIVAIVGTKAEALTLQNISPVNFATKKIYIKYQENTPRGGDRNARQQPIVSNIRMERKALESFVKRHYDADDRMLNLTNLSAHFPNLKTIDFNNRSFTLQLLDILSTECHDILTIVLNRNNITKLAPFEQLNKYRLKIVNISLESNNISNFDELLHLKDLSLRELVMTDNPCCASLDDLQYQLEVVRRLPELGFLDTRRIKQGADTHPITQLPPIQANFFDAPNRQALADGFLQKYYEAFDGDRDSLTHAYADKSCFSLSIVSVSKPVGRGGSTFRGDKFVPYVPSDRNLVNNTSLDTRTSTLKTGPTHIVGTILDLPLSKHDYESFTVDCFVTSIGTFEMLNIFVHGSFVEISSKVKRSFSRVFLLAQPPAATADGWPLVIINDMFYVRYWTAKRVKAPPPVVPTTPPPSNTLDQATMREMVMRLSSMTTMNLKYSEECLQVNNWGYDQALVNFQELRTNNKIPPEAFLK